jgi:hypothetical protein
LSTFFSFGKDGIFISLGRFATAKRTGAAEKTKNSSSARAAPV